MMEATERCTFRHSLFTQKKFKMKRVIQKTYPFLIKKISKQDNIPAGYTDVLPDKNLIKKKWNGKRWIEAATFEEIQAHKKQVQQQQDADFQAQKKADGITYADEINTKLIGIMRGKTQAQIDDLDIEFRAKILKYLDLIEGGDWWTAKRMISNTTLPKIPEIKTLFLEVRQHIRNYVNENYI